LTGASAGIGREIARLVGPRARVLVIVARRRERLEELAGELTSKSPGLKVDVRPTDLSDPDAAVAMVDAVAAEHGPVDVLINNAGLGDVMLFEVSDPAKNQRMIDVNVSALVAMTRAVIPAMVQRKGGGVLMISSGFGLTWLPGLAAYIGTKHFVTGFTESLRCEMAGTGVAITQICPGPVATEFEAIAGNPTGEKVPSIIEISAQRCARESIAAFDKRRAMHIPGLLIRWFTRLGIWTPFWLRRLLYGPIARELRRRIASNAG